MKKVLILTDSLGAPRFKPERIEYEDTYAYKLKKVFEKRLYDVMLVTKHGYTSEDIKIFICNFLELYKPDILIMHFGIVDCAPRAFTKKEIEFALRIKMGRILNLIGKKYHRGISKIRKITRVSKKNFKKNVDIINNICKQLNVDHYYIPILDACHGYIEKSYGVQKSIEDYNSFFYESGKMINVDFAKIDLNSIFMADHHHLNNAGHRFLFEELMKSFSRISIL